MLLQYQGIPGYNIHHMQFYGKHLLADFTNGQYAQLADFQGIYQLLETLPAEIGMRLLTTPHVVPADPGNPDEWGISGFIMIYESHISCHTWPEKGFVSMDVYSCRDFDEHDVVARLKDHWGSADASWQVIDRSTSTDTD